MSPRYFHYFSRIKRSAKAQLHQFIGLVAVLMLQPVSADTIYSGFLNTTIPLEFEPGVTVTIAGGTLNLFFGGVGVANNDLLQPFRTGTDQLHTLLNFSAGTTLNGSTTFLSTGYGGSEDHLVGPTPTFTAGNEGYLGFKLNGANYGWMRVFFTDNTSGAVIKDWAYDDAGGSVVVGAVRQVSQDILLTSGFTLATQLINSGGTTNVIKSGSSTTILSADNSYTGTTTVTAGKLVINGNQTAATGATTVSGADTRLGGSGTLGGALTIQTGAIYSPGNSPGLQTINGATTFDSGSIFEWDLAANKDTDGYDHDSNPGTPNTNVGVRGTDYDAVNINGAFTVSSGAIFKVIQNTGVDFTDAFWQKNQAWSNIFSVTGAVTGWAANTVVDIYNTSNVLQDFSAYGSFTISGTTLNWSAVPEPTTAVVGLLLGAGLLRRRRPRSGGTCPPMSMKSQ